MKRLGYDPESDREVALADPWRSEQDHVAGALEEGEPGELADDLAVDASLYCRGTVGFRPSAGSCCSTVTWKQ
jgi:hypothetical protein